jgi:hypothetical protein
MFDALHDMGDPVGAVAHARQALKADGHADGYRADGRTGRQSQSDRAGLLCVVPTSLNQEVGEALGAQADPKRLGEVLRKRGFAPSRKVASTPFNMILEARPQSRAERRPARA